MLITATGEMLIAKKDSELLDILDEKLDQHNVIVTQDIEPDFWRVTIVEKPTIAIGIVKPGKPTEPKSDNATTPETKVDTVKSEKPTEESVRNEPGRGIY